MKITLFASSLCFCVLAGVGPAAAQQGVMRTFVSGTGADSGNCNRLAPCRTFAFAVPRTPAGGQLIALDTADYGPVTIAKSLTIAGENDATAIIRGDGLTYGIDVNAGASDVVNLRGLAIGGALAGINIIRGSVNLEHGTITGGTTGIIVGTAGRATVSDTTIVGASQVGVRALTGGGSSVVLDRVSIVGVGTGGGSVGVWSETSLTINDSTIMNWNFGISTTGSAFVKRSVIQGSGTGIYKENGTLYLDTTTITGCSTGVTGLFSSYGNNNIVGNTTNYINGGKDDIQPQVGRPGGRSAAR